MRRARGRLEDAPSPRPTPHLPALVPQPVVVAGVHGLALGEVPADVAACVRDWMVGEDAPGSRALRPGRVWSLGPWIAKRGARSSSLLDLVRRGPALRTFRRALGVRGVRVPRPLCALERRRGLRFESDLLVYERIDGPSLLEVFKHDARAVEAFPGFVAALARNRVLHGDLHPENCLWTGAEWALIDLDSLRGGLHHLRAQGLFERQWARLLRNLEEHPRVRELYEEYARLVGGRAAPWARIQARARALGPLPPDAPRP